MNHELKTWPALFEAVQTGQKTFDLRKNDRNFQTGDILIFREWDPQIKVYSGRKLKKRIGFMIEGEWGLKAGHCAISLLDTIAIDINQKNLLIISFPKDTELEVEKELLDALEKQINDWSMQPDQPIFILSHRSNIQVRLEKITND
jgi:hypothetical protein